MSCFQFKTFFGCFSLYSGGLFITHFTLLYDILSFFIFNSQWIATILHLFVTLLVLYGIYNHHPGFILPSIIYDVFLFIINILIIVLIIPVILFYWSDTRNYVAEYLKHTFHVYSSQTMLWFVILCVCYIVIVFIRLYFALVIYNLRKSFKITNQNTV